MKENGKMINKMDKVGKFGPMDQNIGVLTPMDKKMDLENLNGEMEVFILEIL